MTMRETGHRPPGRLWRAFATLAAVALLLLALHASRTLWNKPPDGQELLASARDALRRGDVARCEVLAQRIPRGDEAWVPGRLLAGEAAMRDGRFDTAAQYFQAIPRDGSVPSVQAARSLGEIARHTGRLTEAEQAYRYVLDHDPDSPDVQERLAFLLAMTGRRWEALPHFVALLRSGTATFDELALLADLDRPIEQDEFLNDCAAQAPDDVLVQLGLAARRADLGYERDARQRLERIVVDAPGLLAAQALLGELLSSGGEREFLAWYAQLPASLADAPEIWFVRGLRARHNVELSAAARCFWETLRRRPTHRRACYQLGQVLTALENPAGPDFVQRAAALVALTQELDAVLRTRGEEPAAIGRVAGLLENMGRHLEACAWAARAADRFPHEIWAHQAVARLLPTLSANTPLVIASEDLALRHDLSGLPADDLRSRPAAPVAGDLAMDRLPGTLHFVEETDAGVDFVYENGADPATPGARMFEQTGGGVAVIDFDADGWPDLYFPQGARWETGSKLPAPSPRLTDRLYRNDRGRRFVDATRFAGIADADFSQGAAIGDFDNDGFPDLYVGNIGRNRLSWNNGDGTFTDITASAGLEGEDWTTSCAVVDLNADGLPDLFDVTYVSGPDVYEALCNGRACSPKNFEGTADRLHINRGDGTFEHAPGLAGSASGSKGMGLIAADLHGHGRPSLFITNDQVPNFLLRNSPSDDRFNLKLHDAAFVSGVAYNGDGLAMAGMGIAADDADGDGRVDFFVTNFKDESNTLYLQNGDALFADMTNAAGLRAASYAYVGWGTQFLDADLDGWPDLVLVNGHVDDYRDQPGGEYHMRPQVFRNLGEARFIEVHAPDAGEYFGRKSLGRGLARLDWNADGRMDFVVSNIGDRASLVTNRTENAGHFLNVQVHALETARDAIGTVVDVTAAENRWTKQLVGGDGFMAANERMLQFGLGDAALVSEVRIHWPSGQVTTIHEVPADMTLEVVEGSKTAVMRRDGDPFRGSLSTEMH